MSKAAQDMGLTNATVSRRIQELEQQLGAELLHRSTKGLTLTPTGKAYFRECSELLVELDLRIHNLGGELGGLRGELKVMAPQNLGDGPLDEFWREFVDKHPEISLTIQLGDPSEDVIEQQADIALRSGVQNSSTLIQKLIGNVPLVLVASSRSKHPLPESLVMLLEVPSIAAKLFSTWRLTSGGHSETIRKQHAHLSNDMRVTLNLVRAGAGVALLPMSMVHRGLASGELVRVLPKWEGEPRSLFLVWPYQRSLSVRAVLFREELLAFIQRQEWLAPQK